jgi:hypothetical protein
MVYNAMAARWHGEYEHLPRGQVSANDIIQTDR